MLIPAPLQTMTARSESRPTTSGQGVVQNAGENTRNPHQPLIFPGKCVTECVFVGDTPSRIVVVSDIGIVAPGAGPWEAALDLAESDPAVLGAHSAEYLVRDVADRPNSSIVRLCRSHPRPLYSTVPSLTEHEHGGRR